MTNVRIGVMYDRDWAPEDLPGFARRAEALGVDDLWVVEDLGWGGGVSAAAVALGATERLRVGIGIAPAPLRSPALLAMELAPLARVFPGRMVAGIGGSEPAFGQRPPLGAWQAHTCPAVNARTDSTQALLEMRRSPNPLPYASCCLRRCSEPHEFP